MEAPADRSRRRGHSDRAERRACLRGVHTGQFHRGHRSENLRGDRPHRCGRRTGRSRLGCSPVVSPHPAGARGPIPQPPPPHVWAARFTPQQVAKALVAQTSSQFVPCFDPKVPPSAVLKKLLRFCCPPTPRNEVPPPRAEACTPDNSIAVVDLKTFAVTGTFEVGGEPDG